MKLRTELSPAFRGGISHSSSLLLLGSCFADEVGRRLQADGFDATVNPTGTLFNPLSIVATVEALRRHRVYTAADLIENQGLWRSLDHHTRLAHADRNTALDRINAAMAQGGEALLRATHVIVTFGTAYVFERQGRVVCNCHKLPASQFVRRRITADEIVDAWQPVVDLFPDKRFIFTVSPVRHLADTLHGNQLSKATLLMAVDRLSGVDYFPAYEALVDDLRDYRFYADDMVHPSPLAADYVHSLFLHTYCDEATRQRAAAETKAARRALHRPLL